MGNRRSNSKHGGAWSGNGFLPFLVNFLRSPYFTLYTLLLQLRIPVADWMFDVYTPFNNGCWDGSLEELDRVLALIAKYKMTALIDIHTARGSQVHFYTPPIHLNASYKSYIFSKNGLDNSGDTSHYEWVGTLADSGSAKYNHW